LRGPAVAPPSSSVPVADGDFLARLATHVVNGFALVNGAVQDLNTQVIELKADMGIFQQDAVRHIAQQDRHVEDLQKAVQAITRVYTDYECTVRGFTEMHCSLFPSVEETGTWGKELTRRYRAHMPEGKFRQIPCLKYGLKVNVYEFWMLTTYFGELGLYKG